MAEKSTAVLISIQPKWCGLIASGKKTVEVRKTRPKIDTPFKCYIYQSKSKDRLMYVMKDGDENYGVIYHGKPVFIKTYSKYSNPYEQKVIGEFVCDEIREYYPISNIDPINKPYGDDILASSCVSAEELNDFAWSGSGYGKLYGWHISDLKVFDNPKELSQFEKPCSHNCVHCKFYCTSSLEEPAYCEWVDCVITKPPQSWCYVEASSNE